MKFFMNNTIVKPIITLFNSNIAQFFKYVFVGFLNTGVYYGIYFVMLKSSFFMPYRKRQYSHGWIDSNGRTILQHYAIWQKRLSFTHDGFKDTIGFGALFSLLAVICKYLSSLIKLQTPKDYTFSSIEKKDLR